MKRLIILLLLIGLVFGVIYSLGFSKEVEALPKKEFFDFVEIKKLINNYFRALSIGDKEEILKYVTIEYASDKKNFDDIIESFKEFGKISFIGSSKIIPIEEKQVVEYKIFIIYNEIHTIHRVWIKEFKDGTVKVVGHSISVFTIKKE